MLYRDLGEHIRKQVGIAFSSGDSFRGDASLCLKKYESLKRLVDDHYNKKYKCSIQTSASGLSAQNCSVVLSKESLGLLQKKNENFVKSIFVKAKNKISTPDEQQKPSQASSVGRGN